jgi:hypothetical protein
MTEANTVDVQLINKWLENLESGKVKQTVGALTSQNAQCFCCLGVAAKAAGYKVKKNYYDSKRYYDIGFDFGSDHGLVNGVLPSEVASKLGLITDYRDEAYNTPLHIDKYVTMNDDQSATFAQIAAELRKDYEAAGISLTA